MVDGEILAAERRMLEESISTYRASKEQDKLAASLYELGKMLRLADKLDLADTTFVESIELFTSIDDLNNVAYAKFERGKVLGLLARYDDAFSSYDEALSIWKDRGDELGKAIAMGQIGSLKIKQNPYIFKYLKKLVILFC